MATYIQWIDQYKGLEDKLFVFQFTAAEDPYSFLEIMAQHSYETATPRVHARKHLHSADDKPDFKQYIHRKQIVIQRLFAPLPESPLKMDYINDRDCRTLVFNGPNETFVFHGYSFEQRKVTSEEFTSGIRRENAQRFLDEVIALYSTSIIKN